MVGDLVYTAASVRALQPSDDGERYEVCDAEIPELRVRVGKREKVWILRTRLRGERLALTYEDGNAEAVKPATARLWAEKQLKLVKDGIDPRVEAKRAATDTVAAVVANWIALDQVGRGNRTAGEVERVMRREVLPFVGRQPISKVTRREWNALIETVEKRAPTMARRLFAYIHRMLRWAVSKGYIESSPMADALKPGVEVVRTRWHDDEKEVGDLWHAFESMPWPFGRIYQLLLLTGARREEIGGLLWSEIDLEQRRIVKPGKRTKRLPKHAHIDNIIPLSAAALAIIEKLPRREPEKGKPDFVFTTTGATSVSGWSRAKRQIDAIIAAKREAEGRAPIQPWRNHDLRRTLSSNMQKLGVDPFIVDALNSHVGGIRAVYQRYGYRPELAAAIEKWGEFVSGLVAAQPVARRRLSKTAAALEAWGQETGR
ncbi:MAG: tyrosine-type recombinase/integrase [Bauldia sp.]